jgi:hypothetical protein
VTLPHVVGIDVGLTCTGVATAGRVMRSARIGQKGVTLLPLAERIEAIMSLGSAILDEAYLKPEEVPARTPAAWRRPWLVVMEAPDTSNAFGGLTERIQLYHEVARALIDRRIPLAILPSAILKGYASNNGGVDRQKRRVMAAVRGTWPEYGNVNDDEADAAVLAAMGLDKLTGQRRVPDGQAADWLNRHSVQWPSEIPGWPDGPPRGLI